MVPATHMDVTLARTTYLSGTADPVHPFMETVFPGCCGLYQQDKDETPSVSNNLVPHISWIHSSPCPWWLRPVCKTNGDQHKIREVIIMLFLIGAYKESRIGPGFEPWGTPHTWGTNEAIQLISILKCLSNTVSKNVMISGVKGWSQAVLLPFKHIRGSFSNHVVSSVARLEFIKDTGSSSFDQSK